MTAVVYIDNSNTIELSGLRNNVDDVVDTGATVAVTVVDGDGVPLVGQPWPAAMAHDADGTYRVTLNPGIEFVNGGLYYAQAEAVGTGGEVARWTLRLRAKERGAC